MSKKRTTPKSSKKRAVRSVQPAENTRTPQEIAEERIKEWRVNPVKPTALIRKDYEQEVARQDRLLDLRGLGLKAVPESLRNLPEVALVDLANNQIHELPEWIGELKALRGISLVGNLLRQLPPQIGELPELHLLLLSRNRLESLPESLRHLTLSAIRLEGNPGLGLPKSILKRPPQ